MAVKLLALLALVALATSHPTQPPNQASPVPSETSVVSPIQPSSTNDINGDAGADSKPVVEVEKFLNDMVNKINKYRLMHAATPLVLSLNLTNKAELWAVKLANKDQEELNTNSKFGQAIFSSSNPDNVVNASVESWYNQIVHYNYYRVIANPKTSYFTQLVWKQTQEVGIGKATSSSGKTYIVAYFNPPSNKGEMLANVLPVTGSGVGKKGLANCSGDYKHYNNSCFKLFRGPRTWESAVHKCTEQFASLAPVEGEGEDYFIKSLLTTNKVNYTWIGLGDPDNDTIFAFVDGTPSHFTNWDLIQKDVQGKRCAVVGESFNWKYIPCGKGASFVCRRKLRDISVYEVVILYLNKFWTDKLLTPEEPRYKALKTHIESAMFEVYRDDDWFDEVDFRDFQKTEGDRILAVLRIHFTPDDDSPSDPLEKLRAKLQGGSASESSKRSMIKGVLYGEPVEIVNITLIIEQPQPVLCPGFCTVQHCPPAMCNPSCCNQNTLYNHNTQSALGYPGVQPQQAYQQNPYQSYQQNYQSSQPYSGYTGYNGNSGNSGYAGNSGYSGSPIPQGGAQVAPKAEENPDEKTKLSSSKKNDEATKVPESAPEEQSKPQTSRPPRPSSRPAPYPQPNPVGLPGSYNPGGYGQGYPYQRYQNTYPQHQQQQLYQSAYAQPNPSAYASPYPQPQQQQLYQSAYAQPNPSAYASPYPQPQQQQLYQSASPSPYAQPNPSSYPSPYQQYQPYPGSLSNQPQGPPSEQEKPKSPKGKKRLGKRLRKHRQHHSSYPTYPQGYPSPYYSTGNPSYPYPGQTAPQGIPQNPSYMSANVAYPGQVAGTGYSGTYGSSSYAAYPSPSYQGAGYAMPGQNQYSAQSCTGVCADSCAPECSPACCRSRGSRRRHH